MTQAARRLEWSEQTRPAEHSVREILVELWENTESLFRGELELATAEVDRGLARAKKEAAGAAVGGAVLHGGFLCLLATAILLLSRVMDAWVAALLVGAACSAAGAALLVRSGQQLKPERLAPRRTAKTLRDDVSMMKEVTK